jgi:hypothetical protein
MAPKAKQTQMIPVQGTSKPLPKVSPQVQKAAVEEMNEALYAVYEKADAVLLSEAECVIRARHTLGQLVLQVYEDSENTYGSKSIEKLSQALGRNTTILYDAKKFVELYSEEEVDQILQARNTSQQPLTWSHMEALIRLQDEDARADMLELALQESLTAGELVKEIQKKSGGKKSNSTGRPLSKPKNFEGYLDSIMTTSEVVIKKATQVWFDEENDLVTAANALEEVDEATLAKLDDTLTELGEHDNIVGELTKALQDVKETLVAKLEAAEKEKKKAAKKAPAKVVAKVAPKAAPKPAPKKVVKEEPEELEEDELEPEDLVEDEVVGEETVTEDDSDVPPDEVSPDEEDDLDDEEFNEADEEAEKALAAKLKAKGGNVKALPKQPVGKKS